MANNGNSKIKFLELLKLLKQYSDEEHPLSAAQLCTRLQKQGIEAERKSVCRDIALLNNYGFDIIHTYMPTQGFFIAKRDFELPEVRLLMDAVLAAPFITNKKTAELTAKLCGLLSCYQAEDVFKQINVEQRVKFENEEIYYNIDTINHVLVLSLENEDDGNFIQVTNYKLDLDELTRADILLELPTKYLCSENCKGLCPVCGKNLNDGTCNCDLHQIDPRLEALKKLID